MADTDRIQRQASPAPPPRAVQPTSESSARFSDLLRQRRQPQQQPRQAEPDAKPDGETPAATPAATPAPARSRAPAVQREQEQPVATQPGEARRDGAAPVSAAALLSADDQQRLVRLTRTVASFCNDRAVSDSDGWQVSIRLKPEVLPDTTLHLSVSVHWLTLRFSIGDAGALALVSQHSDALTRALESALVRKRDVSITFD